MSWQTEVIADLEMFIDRVEDGYVPAKYRDWECPDPELILSEFDTNWETVDKIKARIEELCAEEVQP